MHVFKILLWYHIETKANLMELKELIDGIEIQTQPGISGSEGLKVVCFFS